jgi:hypothetical protein
MMSVYVIAEFPMSETGAQDFIDWAGGDDGYAASETHDGYEFVQALIAEDNRTIYLAERWATKEVHQAYTQVRAKGSLMEFIIPRLISDFKVTYFNELDILRNTHAKSD